MGSSERTPGTITKVQDRLSISGDWTLAHYADLLRLVERHGQAADGGFREVDLRDLGALDTAGARLIARLLGSAGSAGSDRWTQGLDPERHALLRTVAEAESRLETPRKRGTFWPLNALDQLGRSVSGLARQQYLIMGFVGLTLATLASIALNPRRWRFTSLIWHIQNTGLNALPIVALLTFLVGSVVAFLGATVLEDFGVTIYTVHLVAFSFLREFGVLLAAILMAGRTASAYTAQIGSMKANEEIDAIRAQGLDPMELLVVPRVLAMMLTLPILSFVGMLSGILGGAMVCVLSLNISPTQFMAILQQDIPVQHLLVGLSKAPIFAFLIAVIGCLEGFKVSGSAQSVGEHTTSSVVQSIFIVILLDAVAAIFFMEMGW